MNKSTILILLVFLVLTILRVSNPHSNSSANVEKVQKPTESSLTALPEANQIVQDEGYSATIYNDSLGNETAGYGHLITEEDKELLQEDGTFSQETIDQWFEQDMREAQEDVDAYLGGQEVPDEVRNVLANMAFNMGRTNLSEFKKMKKAIEEENWDEMAKQMQESEWYATVGNRADRLIQRIRLLNSQGS
jgi:GH24 family phage-related lysozyme (muramidase)